MGISGSTRFRLVDGMTHRSKILFIVAALLLPNVAYAQSGCGGQAPAGKFCGNSTGVTGLPGFVTVPAGSLTPIAGGTVLGNPAAITGVPIATSAPVLGVPGASSGQLGLAGATGGTVTVLTDSSTGTYNFRLPIAAGTAGQPLLSGGGGATAMTFGTLQVPAGGTGLTSGTSGGIPFFNSGTTMASSVLLAANQLMLGGGVATAPSTLGSLGTTTTVLHGNAAGAPTFGAVSLTADVSGTLPQANGGTGFSTYALGDTIYASATNVLSKLTGNITTTKQYLSQTGSGAASAAPAWATIAGADITGAALTKTDDTNVTMTLGGTPTTALLRAASMTLGWTGQLGLTRGGTAASLTASNGGIVYSTSSALAILSGTATANQILVSGASTTPAWSTATYPLTAAAGTMLNAGSSNVITATATPTLGANGGTGGQITLNGATSGSAAIRVAAAAGTSTIFQLPNTNGSNTYVLQTDGTGVTSWVPSAGGGTVTSITCAATMTCTAANPIVATGTIAINLNNANTWTAAQSFNDSQLVLNGSSSGNTTLHASAAAGSSNITFPNANDTVAILGGANQVVAGGAIVTSLSQPTGSVTVACNNRPLHYITNNGAWTITAPTGDGSCMMLITNGASAATPAFSGFTVAAGNTGDPLTNTNTSKFILSVVRINGTSTYTVKALQ